MKRRIAESSQLDTKNANLDDAYFSVGRGQFLEGIKPVQEWQSAMRRLPLSVSQRGMWMGAKIGPKDATFNLAEYCEILGPVDPGLFIAAVKRVANEAEIWRVQIIDDEDGPYQLLAPVSVRPVPFVDVSQQSDPKAAAERWMMDELLQPVDVAVDPLWCCALFKIAEDRYFWYHRSHHIVLDGFSAGLLSRRVAELYNASLEGRDPGPNPFPGLEQQLALEKNYRESSRFQRDKDYWTTRLAALPEPSSLSRRSAKAGGGLRRSTARLSVSESAVLRQIGDVSGGSLPQVLIALMASYIYRHTGEDDLVFGMPVSGRSSKAMREIPCMMANAVTIRLQMRADITLGELIGQVAKVVRSALRHQQYRYEELRRDLGLLAKGQQISLVGVNIEPFDYDLRFGGHPSIAHNMSNGTIEDLTFFVYDRGDDKGLRIDLDANPSLYSQQELDEHRDRLQRLLSGLLATPEQAITNIDLLSAAERQQLLYDWNQTSAPTAEQRFDQAFATQAVAAPSAVALLCDGQRMSYQQLDERANQLAAELVAQGLGPGDYIAVALPRSNDLVVALLAIMKSGAAYVPLDPQQPAPRLKMILQEAQPGLLISTETIAEALGEGVERCLNLAALDWTALPSHQVKPAGIIDSESPAYVIYTSGSTGRPKGVVISHASLMNFLLGMNELLEINQQDKVLALTTISFDIAALEIYLPLMIGAQVVMCSKETARDPDRLFGIIKACDVSVMQATPSHWQALLLDHLDELKGLKPLVGGEALPVNLAKQLLQLGRGVVNLYGPTETTVWSTAMQLSWGDVENTLSAPPIGKPIRNTQVYVLDSSKQPVPLGVIGELYIGGAGVAQGYLNRPELTAERFVDNPFATGKMYQTGDLARWREDGVLEYLGRNDFQMKIRGFRIEAEEVEAQLQACAGVQQAVVSLRQDPTGEKRLVAYLLAEDDQQDSFDPAALRKSLEAVLPDYMVPAVYVSVDSLPLNVNGKLDRKALPEPQWLVKTEYFPPRNELERQLEILWMEIFQCQRVSIHDSFFELGGDSLMAAKMVSRIRDITGKPVPMVAIFEAASIAELAEQLEASWNSESPVKDPLDRLLTLRKGGSSEPLFCIHPVIGLGWGYASLSRHLPDDRPLYALQAKGLNGEGELPQSIEDIAADYIREIRRVQPSGPYHFLGWSMGGIIAYEMSRQLQAASEGISMLAILDAYPFVQRADKVWNNELALVENALAFLNLDVSKSEAMPQTMDQLTEFLCREYAIFDLPVVQEMQRADIDIVSGMRKVIENNLELVRHYQPGPLTADILFFQAAHSSQVAVGELLHHQPEAWRTALNGELIVYTLECDHQQMLQDVATDVMGPVLNDVLQPEAAMQA